MSKLILYDFQCPQCGTFEELAKSDIHSVPCPQCKSPSQRLISPVRIGLLAMATSDSASPESINYFEKVHRQRRAIEEKSLREHGDYGNMAGSDGGSPLTPEAAGKLG